MLHIINSFPISSALLDFTHSGDTVIFTDNAVFAAIHENIKKEPKTQKTFSHINLCVRKADLLIRNISTKELLRGVAIIDDMQFESAISEDSMVRSSN